MKAFIKIRRNEALDEIRRARDRLDHAEELLRGEETIESYNVDRAHEQIGQAITSLTRSQDRVLRLAYFVLDEERGAPS